MPSSTTSRIINDASQYIAGPQDGWKGPADLSARCYAAWNEDAMYFAILVQDNAVVPCSGATSAWGTAVDMQWQQALTPGACDLTISPAAGGKALVRPNGEASSAVQGVTAASAVSSTGYTIELRIPLTERNFPARQWQAGRPVKLSFLIHDSDDPKSEAPRKALGWSVSPDLKNAEDTSGWATVILDEARP